MNPFIPRPAREYTDEHCIGKWLREESPLTRLKAITLKAGGMQMQKAIDEAKAASKVAA